MNVRWIVGACTAATLGLAGMFALAEDAKKPGPPLPGKYAGEATCKKCHFKQDKTWKASPHAKAFEVLPAKYKDDGACTTCHTTGKGQPGGYESVAKTPALGGVQCEMCHGPAAEHAEVAQANEAKKDDADVKAKLRALVRPAGGEFCTGCHLMQAHQKHPEYEKEAGK